MKIISLTNIAEAQREERSKNERLCAKCAHSPDYYKEHFENLGDQDYRHHMSHELQALKREVEELKQKTK